jgi:hypothetical protein
VRQTGSTVNRIDTIAKLVAQIRTRIFHATFLKGRGGKTHRFIGKPGVYFLVDAV